MSWFSDQGLPWRTMAYLFFLKKRQQRQPCLSMTETHAHTAAGSPRKHLAIEKMQGLGSFLIQHGNTDQSHLLMSTLKPSGEHFEVCTRMLLASACLDSPATSSLATGCHAHRADFEYTALITRRLSME